MSLSIASNNAGAVLSANGNFCAIAAWEPAPAQQAASNISGIGCSLITNISYTVVNATATGTLTFQEQGLDGVWRAMATPAPIVLSNVTINGTITGAYHGVRLALTALAVSTVTYAELRGTVI